MNNLTNSRDGELVLDNSLSISIRLLIEESKRKVFTSVNTEMTLLYWNIGKYINENLKTGKSTDYGKNILPTLSAKLVEDYGKGFSQRNLARMVKLYDFFPDKDIFQALSAKLSWSHFVELLGISDSLQREFYYTLCINEHWSVRQLNECINSMLYERSALSKKSDQTIKNDLEALRNQGDMSTDVAFKNPYILDFLELRDTYSEKDLEQSILYHLQ